MPKFRPAFLFFLLFKINKVHLLFLIIGKNRA